MKRFLPLFWTAVALVITDLVLNQMTAYPTDPLESETIGPLQRYFNYGRSIESKVRWMAGPDDVHAAPLATTGWLYPEISPAKVGSGDERMVVAIYGMSFSARVGEHLAAVDRGLLVRNVGGPGSTLSRTYAHYLSDGRGRDAAVVVLGILASSVPVTGTVTHMTWNFEAPSGHFYPKFRLGADSESLVRIDPPVNSLAEFRDAMSDDVRWSEVVRFLHEQDPYYDEWAFNASPLDQSVIGRLIRRGWAQVSFRDRLARFHQTGGFTDHDDNLKINRLLVERFVEQARMDGKLPVILLFNDRGYQAHLFEALHDILNRLRVDYLSSHEFVEADDLAKFEQDGHFLPEYDRAIAQRLARRIADARMAGSVKGSFE